MSKKINVNPGHYKVGGRERQGENIVVDKHKAELRRNEASQPKRSTNPQPRPRKKR
jgi:hypothetical protein